MKFPGSQVGSFSPFDDSCTNFVKPSIKIQKSHKQSDHDSSYEVDECFIEDDLEETK